MPIEVIVHEPCLDKSPTSDRVAFLKVRADDRLHADRAARAFFRMYPEKSVAIVPDNGDPPEYLMKNVQSIPVHRSDTTGGLDK